MSLQVNSLCSGPRTISAYDSLWNHSKTLFQELIRPILSSTGHPLERAAFDEWKNRYIRICNTAKTCFSLVEHSQRSLIKQHWAQLRAASDFLIKMGRVWSLFRSTMEINCTEELALAMQHAESMCSFETASSDLSLKGSFKTIANDDELWQAVNCRVMLGEEKVLMEDIFSLISLDIASCVGFTFLELVRLSEIDDVTKFLVKMYLQAPEEIIEEIIEKNSEGDLFGFWLHSIRIDLESGCLVPDVRSISYESLEQWYATCSLAAKPFIKRIMNMKLWQDSFDVTEALLQKTIQKVVLSKSKFEDTLEACTNIGVIRAYLIKEIKNPSPLVHFSMEAITELLSLCHNYRIELPAKETLYRSLTNQIHQYLINRHASRSERIRRKGLYNSFLERLGVDFTIVSDPFASSNLAHSLLSKFGYSGLSQKSNVLEASDLSRAVFSSVELSTETSTQPVASNTIIDSINRSTSDNKKGKQSKRMPLDHQERPVFSMQASLDTTENPNNTDILLPQVLPEDFISTLTSDHDRQGKEQLVGYTRHEVRNFNKPASSISIESFTRKDFALLRSFSYHPRVQEWFTDPQRALCRPEYAHLDSPHVGQQIRDRIIMAHAFSQLVDKLVEMLGVETAWRGSNDQEDHPHYSIPGEIQFADGTKLRGLFTYCFNANNGQCYHRHFTIKESTSEIVKEVLSKRARQYDFPSLEERTMPSTQSPLDVGIDSHSDGYELPTTSPFYKEIFDTRNQVTLRLFTSREKPLY